MIIEIKVTVHALIAMGLLFLGGAVVTCIALGLIVIIPLELLGYSLNYDLLRWPGLIGGIVQVARGALAGSLNRSVLMPNL